MKAIILDQPGSFSTADIPEPKPVANEAIVRVSRVGMCGTDLHAFRGRQPFFTYPRILGHEICAEIVEIEDNEQGLQAGMVCSVAPYLYCGSCLACRHGKTNCCVKLQLLGVHVDGGMREYFSVPLHTLHHSPKLTREQLALVEPLSIGGHAVARAQLKPDDTIFVIGTGPIGLSLIAHAKTIGVKVIAMDVSEDRLRFAREQFNVDATVLSGDNVSGQLADLTNGDMPLVVFDATGNVASMNDSFNYPSNGGRLILVGLHLDFVTFRDQDFHRKEMTVMSSRNATVSDFQRTISLLEAGQIHIDPWITHRVKESELIAEFPTWLDAKAGFIKAIVEWS